MTPLLPWRAAAALLATVLLAARATAGAQTGAQAAAPTVATFEPYTLRVQDGRTVAGELGRLGVPERHARPDGRRIELAFVRLKSTATSPGAPIVFLAGGPGDSGIALATVPEYLALFERLRQVGDVVLLDQRGVGLSTPQPSCPPRGPVALDMLLSRDAALRHVSAAVRACAAELRARGIDPAAYTTEESADDLESLRIALGAPTLDLVAHSYGTHLALAAVRRHGRSLGRVVLSSTEGPGDTWKHPHVYDLQLRKIAALAAADPTVAAEVPDLYALTARLLDQLDRQPAQVTLTDPRTRASVQIPVGRWGLQYVLRRDVGDANDIGGFPALLHATARGDLGPLQRLAQRRYGNFGVRGISMIRFTVDCASGADATRLAQIAREAPGSLFGAATNDLFPEICAATGVPMLGDAFRTPISSAVPTLFVSGTLDANTPPFQAERVRWGFTNAHHLVVENAGHESMLPHPAVQEAIAGFLAGRAPRDRTIALPPIRFAPPAGR